jgi:uncharacterized protein
MKILSLSDKELSFIYSPQVRRRFTDVDLVVGCGDLPYAYLEYVFDALGAELFFVRGNHDEAGDVSNPMDIGRGVPGDMYVQHKAPRGGIDLHRKLLNYHGLLLGGIEGSLRYRPGSFQYSQTQMWRYVLWLAPWLLRNRMLYGRYLDVFVSHAPPAGIHDASDLPHQGIKAFRWLISVFQPAYFLHGHVHIYRPDDPVETQVGKTRVINSYGFRLTEVDISASGRSA